MTPQSQYYDRGVNILYKIMTGRSLFYGGHFTTLHRLCLPVEHFDPYMLFNMNSV